MEQKKYSLKKKKKHNCLKSLFHKMHSLLKQMKFCDVIHTVMPQEKLEKSKTGEVNARMMREI